MLNETLLYDSAEKFKLSDPIDVCFLLVCICFCVPIVPAVGLGYSGYSTRRNGLTAFFPSLLALACCSVQWWTIGYTLAYGEGGNSLVGGLGNFFHKGVGVELVGTVPGLLFSMFQLVFLATVCAIVLGGACERGRLLPLIPFTLLWATFVYCPLAHMTWGANGLIAGFGALDFAGGTPVHICSGASATALSVYLSRPLFRSRKSVERTPSHLRLHRPHNSLCQLISLVSIWSGWLAFDAGTTLSLNYKSVLALFTTNLAASGGIITWLLLDYRKCGVWSLDSCFMGMISGLVAITPAAGFVGIGSAFIMGSIGATLCRQALRFKSSALAEKLRWVDNGDSFATHCLGGVYATLATGVFASREVAAYDGITDIQGGVIFDGNHFQIFPQLAEGLIGFVWSFCASYAIYALLDCVPGLEVLCTDKEIMIGMDKAQMNESLYEAQWEEEADYVPLNNGLISLP